MWSILRCVPISKVGLGSNWGIRFRTLLPLWISQRLCLYVHNFLLHKARKLLNNIIVIETKEVVFLVISPVAFNQKFQIHIILFLSKCLIENFLSLCFEAPKPIQMNYKNSEEERQHLESYLTKCCNSTLLFIDALRDNLKHHNIFQLDFKSIHSRF